MTQEEIENYAYQVRRKYQDEQAELKGGMCEHIMFDAMKIEKGVLLGISFAQSKMYSEEDMLKFCNYVLSTPITKATSPTHKEEYIPKEFKLLNAELINNGKEIIREYFETN